LARVAAAAAEAGEPLVDLGRGNPEVGPPEHVVRALAESAGRPDVHGYAPFAGLPALKEALAARYRDAYGVEVDPAKEVAVLPGTKTGLMEFALCAVERGRFSRSKSYGMAGWRLGFAVGNSELVRRIETLQDHAFAGIFRPVQEAGIAALTGPQDSVEDRRATYERRRDRALAALGGLDARSEGTFFVWFRLPEAATVERLLVEHRVAVAPGEGFGTRGAGWARLSLAVTDETLDRGLERIAAAFG